MSRPLLGVSLCAALLGASAARAQGYGTED